MKKTDQTPAMEKLRQEWALTPKRFCRLLGIVPDLYHKYLKRLRDDPAATMHTFHHRSKFDSLVSRVGFPKTMAIYHGLGINAGFFKEMYSPKEVPLFEQLRNTPLDFIQEEVRDLSRFEQRKLAQKIRAFMDEQPRLAVAR